MLIKSLFTVPSGPPTNVQAISLTSSSIEIRWDLPPPLERNGEIIAFDVELSKVADSGSRNIYNVSGIDFSLHLEGTSRVQKIMQTILAILL